MRFARKKIEVDQMASSSPSIVPIEFVDEHGQRVLCVFAPSNTQQFEVKETGVRGWIRDDLRPRPPRHEAGSRRSPHRGP
jgi:hypothetical protein